MRVVGCRPSYVRYSPGRYCRVLYEVTFRRADTGVEAGVLAHAALLRGNRAERLWAGGEPQRLAERAAALHRPGPGAHAAHLPALRAIVQLYPVDLHLPGLVEAASPEALRERLRAVWPEGPDLRAVEPELVRYKPRRRAVLRLRLDGGGRDAAYAKLRADERGALIEDSARRLAAAGVPLPESLGYLPDLRLMLAAEAPGTRLKELRGDDDFADAMEPVAEMLARVHACSLPGLPSAWLQTEVDELRAEAGTVAALLPAARERVERLAGRLVAGLETLDVPAGTIHGSFHDDQVLVSPAGLTLVDLDSVQRGPLLADVGHFLSYLSADGAEAAREGFLGRVRANERNRPGRAPVRGGVAAALEHASVPRPRARLAGGGRAPRRARRGPPSRVGVERRPDRGGVRDAQLGASLRQRLPLHSNSDASPSASGVAGTNPRRCLARVVSARVSRTSPCGDSP